MNRRPGDDFTVLTDGTEPVGGDVDLDAFVDYLEANSPVALPETGRIRLAE